MTILQFASLLLSMAVITFVIGVLIVRRERRKQNFWQSVSFMESLIESSELSLTAYRNILCAFREFDTIGYKNKKVFKELISDFVTKYKEFIPSDWKITKHGIIPVRCDDIEYLQNNN